MRWCYNLIFHIQLIYCSSTIYWIILHPFTDIWALSCTYFMCILFVHFKLIYSTLNLFAKSFFSSTVLITLIFYYFLISKRENTPPWNYILKVSGYSHLLIFPNEPGNHFVSMALKHLWGRDQAVGNKQCLLLSLRQVALPFYVTWKEAGP